MLSLPSVTLLCADGLDTDRAAAVLERCQRVCRFGAVRLLTHLPTGYAHRREILPLLSIVAYSLFMLKRAYLYVDTPHVLVVQHDGWILNADSWEEAWLGYDYIGPLFIHEHAIVPTSVGTGGFSLRSRALMEFVDRHVPDWDGTDEATERVQAHLGSFEDGVISTQLRPQLLDAGFRIAPPDEAARFAQGGQNDPAYHVARPFGFHGKWMNIDHDTGAVAPPPFIG